MRIFNKECELTYSEFICSLDYSFSILLDRIRQGFLTTEDETHIKSLPNFDPDIFEEITGIRIE